MPRIPVGPHNAQIPVMQSPRLIMPSADGCVETFLRSHNAGRVMTRTSDAIWMVAYAILIALGLVAWAYLPA